MKSKWGLSIKKNKDFRHFRKCRHFENILFELGTVDDSRLPIFILHNTILGNQNVSNERAT
jgi:hypothetical protein